MDFHDVHVGWSLANGSLLLGKHSRLILACAYVATVYDCTALFHLLKTHI